MRSISFDPIELEILADRLIAVADEAASAIRRTAFSTIVRESNDFGVVLTDVSGNAVAESTLGTPGFLGVLPRAVRAMLSERPAPEWRPGDVLATNDPWMLAGHLPDLGLASPLFHHGRLIGFAASTAHLPDIGGAVYGADARELYEEGLFLPPMLLATAGGMNYDLLRLLRANVRLPDEVIGDLYAQLGGHYVLARRLNDILDDAKLDNIDALGKALQDRADRTMRAAIAALPDGAWSSEVVSDGYEGQTTRIRCSVVISGDSLTVDFAGTSPQVDRGLNCVFNATLAWTHYALKCVLDPTTPRNEGATRAFTITAPEGSILNARFPAPCNARSQTCHLLAGAIHTALAEAAPDKVLAESGTSPSLRAVISGADRRGQRFSQMIFGSGGMGASARRDGYSTTPYPTNTGAGGIEALEVAAPLLVWRKELSAGSGGSGRFRGGLGQIVEIEADTDTPTSVSLAADRIVNPPQGLAGGLPGAPVEVRFVSGIMPHPKSRTTLPPGDRLILHFAGGGGFGPPAERDPAAVAQDIVEGYEAPARGVENA